jgi:hypothetical protein
VTSISSPKEEKVCVYCLRSTCEGCPLRFDDKTTLRQVLQEAGVPTKGSFYYTTSEGEADVEVKENEKKSKKSSNKKSKSNKSKKSSKPLPADKKKQVFTNNGDFELVV